MFQVHQVAIAGLVIQVRVVILRQVAAAIHPAVVLVAIPRPAVVIAGLVIQVVAVAYHQIRAAHQVAAIHPAVVLVKDFPHYVRINDTYRQKRKVPSRHGINCPLYAMGSEPQIGVNV